MSTLTAPPRKPRTVKPAHGTARLTLSINGSPYAVRLLAPDAGSGAVAVVRLRKAADGTTYDCSAHEGGWSECTCPDFVFHRDGLGHGPCKHLAALIAVGLL